MARKTHRGEKAELRKQIKSAQQAAGIEAEPLDLGDIQNQIREKFRKGPRAVFTHGCKQPDGELLKICTGVSLALCAEGLSIFQNVGNARSEFVKAAESGDETAAAIAEMRLESSQSMLAEHARLVRSLRPLVSVMAKLVDVQAKLDADEAIGELTIKAFDGEGFSTTFEHDKAVH